MKIYFIRTGVESWENVIALDARLLMLISFSE
jgi:hypothetical protein